MYISCPGLECGKTDYGPRCCREYEECITENGFKSCQLKMTLTSLCPTTSPMITTTTTVWGGSKYIEKDELPLCSVHEDCKIKENCYWSWIFYQKFRKGICINPDNTHDDMMIERRRQMEL